MSAPFNCPSCGTTAPADSGICTTCGTDLQIQNGKYRPIKRPAGVTIIAVLNLLAGALAILGGLSWFVTMAEVVDDSPIAIIGIGLGYIVVGGGWMAAGIGLLKFRSWGRTLQIILSCIGLVGFPILTVVSALVLYYLFRPGIKLLFSGREHADFSAEEHVEIATISSRKASLIAVVVVILVGIFSCGLIAAFIIPSSLGVINRARQKQTIAEMRSISSAVEAYQVDNRFYPMSVTSIEELETLLSPTYIRGFTKNDRWQKPFVFWSNEDGSEYKIISYGQDRVEGPIPGGPTTDYDADIVIENGLFTQWPEGTQNR